MVGAWWLASGGDADATTRFVVASRTIDPGHRFEPDDLRLVAMDLAPSVRAGAFTDPEALLDAVSLGPLGAGALVQEPAIATTPPGSSREFSFAVATPWAVDGALVPGDRIDVLATEPDGGRTTKVLADAVVRHVSSTGGGLGESTGLTITVAVDSAARLEGAVSALRGSELTVARTTGATEAGADPDGEDATDRRAAERSPTTTVAKRTTRPGATTTTTTTTAITTTPSVGG